MRTLAFALLTVVASTAGSLGCAAIIGLDSGDPVADDGGGDDAATLSDDDADGADGAPDSAAGTCAPNTADCNGDPKDGCETMLNSPMHCGACTNVCYGGRQCQMGVCCIMPKMGCFNDTDCCTNKCDKGKCSDKP